MGRGSYSTIGPLLADVLRQLRLDREAPRVPDELVERGGETVRALWGMAWRNAHRDVEELQQKHRRELMQLRADAADTREAVDYAVWEVSVLQEDLKRRQREVEALLASLDSLLNPDAEMHGLPTAA
jgi:hypothetical protein